MTITWQLFRGAGSFPFPELVLCEPRLLLLLLLPIEQRERAQVVQSFFLLDSSPALLFNTRVDKIYAALHQW
jgi:hypothetical protein